MASSSSHKSLQDYNDLIPCQPQQVVKAGLDGEEDEGSWLQLGLGLGSSVAECKTQQHIPNPHLSSSEKTQFQAHHNHDDHIRLGLGLGLKEEIRQGGVLGFDYNEASVREIVLPMPAATINYDHQSLWSSSTNYYHFDDHDHENMPSSWQMDDSEEDGSCFLGVHDHHHHHHHHHDWQMPVSNSYQYHCYSTSSSSMRPNSGLWFTLCASTNREGEGLPQIPKAYIRVKDENVTVSMVKKYLVTKLGLPNEAEIDVYCMGQKLLHTQSLKQVRDSVWLPKLVESVNSAALSFEDFNHTSTCHLLSLHYGKPSL